MGKKQVIFTSAEAKTINDIARHEMITRLLADILVDLQICGIEGWDKREYIRIIQNEINSLKI